MLHAGIEALFGRNRDHHRKRHLFHLRRRNDNHKEEIDELAKFFRINQIQKKINSWYKFCFCCNARLAFNNGR